METDRLVTYQLSTDRYRDIASCIEMVIAIKGRHYEDSLTSTYGRFHKNKFMAHLSFGKSDKVLLPEFESYQGSLESLEIMAERAKPQGLAGLPICISIVDPESPGCDDDSLSSLNRCWRALDLLEQAEMMVERLGGLLKVTSHPAGLLKVELRAYGGFSSFNGLTTEQDGSDGLPLGIYRKLVNILRFPEVS